MLENLSQIAKSPYITDDQREYQIACAAKQIEAHIANGDRQTADLWRIEMESLIRGRSAQQIKRMEEAIGVQA